LENKLLLSPLLLGKMVLKLLPSNNTRENGFFCSSTHSTSPSYALLKSLVSTIPLKLSARSTLKLLAALLILSLSMLNGARSPEKRVDLVTWPFLCWLMCPSRFALIMVSSFKTVMLRVLLIEALSSSILMELSDTFPLMISLSEETSMSILDSSKPSSSWRNTVKSALLSGNLVLRLLSLKLVVLRTRNTGRTSMLKNEWSFLWKYLCNAYSVYSHFSWQKSPCILYFIDSFERIHIPTFQSSRNLIKTWFYLDSLFWLLIKKT